MQQVAAVWGQRGRCVEVLGQSDNGVGVVLGLQCRRTWGNSRRMYFLLYLVFVLVNGFVTFVFMLVDKLIFDFLFWYLL